LCQIKPLQQWTGMKNIQKWLKHSLRISLVFTSIGIAFGATINVNSSDQLEDALADANGGDVILLAAGEYSGNVPDSNEFRVTGRDFGKYVTIASADKTNPAQFSGFHIIDSSYISLDGIKVVAQGREGIGIFNGSHHIKVLNSQVSGHTRFERDNPHYSQVSTLYGIYANGYLPELRAQGFAMHDVKSVIVQNNDVQDIQDSGYAFFNIEKSLIMDNGCDWMAADCFKLGRADNIDFFNNTGASNIYSSPSEQADFVQGQGQISNSRFIGNVALAGSEQIFQGLVFDGATYTNLTFENNVIHVPSIHGISVSSPRSGAPSSGIVARYNTVLHPAGGDYGTNSNTASLILVPSDSVQENNIVANINTKTERRISGTPGRENIIAQFNRSDRSHFYDDYYVNVGKGRGALIRDFSPVPGSAGETKGAYMRILELINGVPSNSNILNSTNNLESSKGIKSFITSVLAKLMGDEG